MNTLAAWLSGPLTIRLDPDRDATLAFSLLGLTISLVVVMFNPDLLAVLGG
jgi:hypothetical protein